MAQLDAFSVRTTAPNSDARLTKDPEVQESERLLNIYHGVRNEWAQNGVADEDFYLGAQWTEKQKKELTRMKQSPIVVNVIYPAVEQAVAALTANAPKFSSTGREGSDIKVGAMFADLMSYVWDNSVGNTQLKQVAKDYYVKGMGLFCAYSDPYADSGKGEVYIKSVDPYDVFFDPNSQDIFCRDSASVIIAKVLSEDQIAVTYPTLVPMLQQATPTEGNPRYPVSDRQGSEGQGSAQNQKEATSKKYEVIDRYTKIRVQKIHAYEPQSGDEHEFDGEEYAKFLDSPAILEYTEGSEQPLPIVNARHLYQAMRMYAQTGGTFHYFIDPNDPNGTPQLAPGPINEQDDMTRGVQSIPGSTVKLEIVKMKDMIEQGFVQVDEIWAPRIKRVFSIGGIMLYNQVMPIEDYPIVPVMNGHTRNPYPTGDVRKVRPLQEYVNKIRSLIIAHASNSTNVKLALPRGSGNKKEILDEMGKAGVGFIEYDAELGNAVIIGPIPLPNELYKNEADARRDIQEILGVYALSQGDSSQAPNTYKGTIALDEYGQRRLKSKKDDIEAGLNQLGKVVIQLIQTTYTEQKTVRILRPNNTPLEFTVNEPIYDDASKEVQGRINDITIGRYDIVTVSGSTLPNNRWARFEYYMELYEKGIIDQVEVLKQTEVIDIEGVMRRASQINQLTQALQQAQDEIKSLRGDMQTAQRETMHANMRVELEKYKTDISNQRNRAEAATNLYVARLSDERAKSKAIADANRRTNSERKK